MFKQYPYGALTIVFASYAKNRPLNWSENVLSYNCNRVMKKTRRGFVPHKMSKMDFTAVFINNFYQISYLAEFYKGKDLCAFFGHFYQTEAENYEKDRYIGHWLWSCWIDLRY